VRRLFPLLAIVAGLALAQDPNSVTKTAYGSITAASANCTAQSCVWIVAPADTIIAAVQLSGTFTATVQFETSVGGSAWTSAADVSGATSATAAGTWNFNLSGARFLRVRASAYTSGAVRVDISTSTLPPSSGVVPVTLSTASPASPTVSGFYLNATSGAITYNLPTITSGTVGAQYCFRNYTTKTGAITLKAPASTYIDVAGANGTAAGTLVSGGAVGDSVCVVAVSTTQYMAYPGNGTWANN